jgi:hypothetical protein
MTVVGAASGVKQVGWIRRSRNPPNKTSRAFDFLRGALLNQK